MSTDVHHFKIGAFECMAVSDGTHTYAPPMFPPPTTLLFTNASEEQLEQVLHGYGIFLTHVDVTETCPHGIGPNNHPLNHPVRITFQHCPVHKGPGISFICVTDDILWTVG